MAGLIQDALKMRFIVLWVAASSSSARVPMSCPILCAERVLIWLASIQDGCSIWTERIGMEMGLLGRWRLEVIRAVMTSWEFVLNRLLLKIRTGREFPCSWPTTCEAGSILAHLISPLSRAAIQMLPLPGLPRPALCLL